jgi:phage baseplate assembly protein gpV
MFFNSDLLDEIRFIIAKETVFLKHFEGVVIDNNDPDNLGRVKVQIPELLQFTPDQIPWTYPEHGLNTIVPPVGKSVVVYFLNGDSAHPIYRGGTSERKDTRLKEYKSPSTVVLYADENILLSWNRLEKTFSLKTNDNEIKIDGENNIIITGENEITINAPHVTVTGGRFEVDGTVTPEGRGALCGMPFCAFSAAPQAGKIAANT